MGTSCSCSSDSKGVPIRVYSGQEIALLIKVQSLIRMKLARLKLKKLKAQLQAQQNTECFCEWYILFLFFDNFCPVFFFLSILLIFVSICLPFRAIVDQQIEVQGKVYPQFVLPADRIKSMVSLLEPSNGRASP